ncbi:MAG: nitroreductase family protein [Desulfoplanes sp.]|nr:nitroreductase family protein [Desulfoplanes sp.]
MQFTIDTERCISCGLCVQDCPVGAITMGKVPRLTGAQRCIRCQHCLAICPTGALSILGVDPDHCTLLKGNLPDPEKLANLIQGRRSVRAYKEENVPPAVIDYLLDIVRHAPTGVNAQQVLLTVMDKRDAVLALREEIYARIAQTKADDAPSDFTKKYLMQATKMWKKKNQDIIFRGAPHFLVASAPRSAPCPVQDTHIALSYFELMAQAMGLGTLWDGMLTWCIKTIFPDIRVRLNIPEDHQIGYAMLFGIPSVTYRRTVQRGPANVNRVTWKT